MRVHTNLSRFAVDKTAKVIRDKLPQAAKTAEAELQPAYARVVKQPINRVAAIRQSQSRWYSTRQAVNNSIRHFSSSAKAGEHVRPGHPSSRTGNAVRQLTSRAPFASTLRPNLTGGALGRTAGGYTHGAGRVGGVRHFSHSPAAPAEVINNVSQAVRAFWLSGQRARFDGSNPRTGEKRYRAVSDLQEKTHRRMQVSNAQASGSYIDFKINPTITAIGPLSNVPRSQDAECVSLNSEGMMNMLSVDFARALKDLAAVMNDLKRLSTLGDLPISLANSTTLRVRFPGCDIGIVEALCRELGIRRGLVHQDPDFDLYNGTNMALLFPFAPSKAPSEATYAPDIRPAKRQRREHVAWDGMMSRERSPGYSHKSATSHDILEEYNIVRENPWLSSPSGYSSLHSSEHDELGALFEPAPIDGVNPASDYEGLEGIYRFLEECDGARRH
jgi:hypothetical protein